MSCLKPMVRAETHESFRNKKGKISWKVEWLQRDQYDDNRCQDLVKSGKYRRINIIPCGQCIECRLQYSREWATRIMLEKQYGYNGKPYPDGTAWFLTLTYADEYLSTFKTIDTETGELFEGISLNKNDIPNFFKRIRNHFPDMKIKYLQCGEYGGKTLRPHHHAIVFGLPLPQEEFKKVGMNNLNQPTWEWKPLSDIWGLGYVNIGRVTWESAAYVARYTLKKANSKDNNWYLAQGMLPEWISMSNGIGEWYFEHNKNKIYKTDSVPVLNKSKGVNVKPPKSYDRMLKEMDPALYEKVKAMREQNGITQESLLRHQTDLTPEERRKVSEARMKQVMKDIRNEI